MEGPDERRPALPVPGRDLALEVFCKTDGVAEQRYPLRHSLASTAGQLPRLGQRRHRLPAARSTAHLDPVQQPGDMEDGRLFGRQPLGLPSSLLGLRVDVVRRVPAPVQDVDDQVDILVARWLVVPLLLARALPKPRHQVSHVTAVMKCPPWAVGRREIGIEG